MRARKGEAWFAALLLAVACLPHLAALRAGFTYDDRVFVVRNQSIRSLAGALGAFGSPFPPEQPERALYRPLTNFSYALDHALSGGEPAVFHATNLLLYLGIAWLAYRVARRSLATRGGARAAALIFAVHPVHCEVVDSVAGRSELLALALGLSALLLFRAAVDPADSASGVQRGRAGRLVAAYLCYALATLAKESAIVLPALLAAHCLLFPAAQASGRRVWGYLIPFAAIAAGCLLLRGWVLGAATPAITVLGDEPLATRLFTLGAIYWEYLRLLFFPATLQVDFYYAHRVGIHATLSPTALAGLAALAGSLATLAALLARALRRSARPADRGPDRAAAFGLLFFLIYLFPVSHVVPFGALLAERFLFAPSLGFALAAAAALEALAARARHPSLRRALAGALALALALAALRGGARAAEWRNPVTLWSPVVRQVPGEFRAYNNLAAGYLELGQPERAVTALRRSLELEPGNAAGLNNLAHALL